MFLTKDGLKFFIKNSMGVPNWVIALPAKMTPTMKFSPLIEIPSEVELPDLSWK